MKSAIDLCTGCNRCVRECPMETANVTYQDEAENIKVKIDTPKCITCGRCVTACKHKARYFSDDTERFLEDLKSGVQISVMAAPSIRTNIPEYKKLFTYLRRLGVNKIYDVSLGADICIWGHVKFFERNGIVPIVTQPCPVIVNYCELYRHDLLKYLSPVQSPMGCASVYMKKYKGIGDRLAAISPCIAKKNEFESTGHIEYNITFSILNDYLEKNGIALPDETTEFDHDESGLGSLFPAPGGLKENIEFFMGKKLHITKAEGFNVYEKLNLYAGSPIEFLPDVYDVLNCAEGCNQGPGYLQERNIFEIEKAMSKKRIKAFESEKKIHYDSVFKLYDETFNYEDFIRKYKPEPGTTPHITEEDIEKAFVVLGKTRYEDKHVDCSACGSNTCYAMARKIALKVNIPENCIVKSKEDAKAEHEENLASHARIANMEKLREADNLMRTMLDATPFGAQLWDMNMNIVECNQATVSLLKLTSKQEFMDRFGDLLPERQPDGRCSKESLSQYFNIAKREHYQRFEWTFQTLDGEEIPCEITLVHKKNMGDNFIAAFVRDLREQKRMLREINEAQVTTSAMFDSNSHINVLFDNRFKVIDCNPAALDFIGFKTKEELYEGFTKRIIEGIPATQPDGRPSVPLPERLITAATKGYVKFETELVLDGIKHNLDVEFKKIPYQNSFAIVGYVYDMTDIIKQKTEIIKAHELNKFQLTKLNLMVKATKIGMWDMEVNAGDILNYSNAITYSNEFKQLLCYETGDDYPDVFGSWMRLVHPDDLTQTLEAFKNHLLDRTGHVPYDVEHRLLKKDGEYSYFRATGETIRDPEGNPLRIAGSLDDITETKNIILDTERQRIEAEAASKAKSSFLSTMSHEIRTPMNAIIGMTAIGKFSHDLDKKDNAFGKIENASKHLLGVINDILDISKIEAGKLELSPVCFEFEKMLQKIADVMNVKVNERRQKLYISIDKSIPETLIADDQRLSQVIANLLSNAVKFTPNEGVIKVDTKLISEKDENCCIQFCVEDTGIGITKDQIARLFQSFEQAEAGTTRKFGGTGLGLTISKRIVELMDGKIWVESEHGKGSKFIFNITAKRGHGVKERLLDDDVNWDNVRLFVVDDEPEIREFFTAVSENIGVSCVVMSSGEEVMEKLGQDDNYNIYFIDWQLPGMNGGELARKIKDMTTNKAVVVVFSSTDWSLIEEEALAAGVKKFVPKPLFPSVVVDVINECIGVNKKERADENLIYSDNFAGSTILLAEDVEINREIVLELLGPTGLSIDCAENGLMAYEMFCAAPEKYKMIFMDIQMPEMDGYDATRKIRSLGLPRAKIIPIIAMTANVFREDVEKCLEAGMNGHVGKPLDINEVIAQLRKYLL